MSLTQDVASAIGNPATSAAQAGNSPKGRFFNNLTYHFETLRAVGYSVSGGADIGEVLETVRLIEECDAQSWFAAWAATSDRVHALAERTKDPLSKGNAYLRAHGYQRLGGFLLPPDDPKRPASWAKEVAYFRQGLDALGVRYERIAVPYDSTNLRAPYFPGPDGANEKPLIVLVGGFDSTMEELYLVLGRVAGARLFGTPLRRPGSGPGVARRPEVRSRLGA